MHFLSRLPIYIFKCLFIVISIVYATGSQNNVPSSPKSPASGQVPFARVKDTLLNVYKPNSEVAFLVFVANDDNKITPMELRDALRAFGYPQSLKETKALLDNFDTNENYVFERDEFFYMLKTMGLKENEDLKTFWKQHDILSAQTAKLDDGKN